MCGGCCFEASTSYCNNLKAGVTREASGLAQQGIKYQLPVIVIGPADQGVRAGACRDLCLFLRENLGRLCSQDSLGSSALKRRQGCSTVVSCGMRREHPARCVAVRKHPINTGYHHTMILI